MARKPLQRHQLSFQFAETDFSSSRTPIVSTGGFPSFEPAELYRLEGHTFALDTENSGLRWYKDRPLGLGIYCPDILEGYLPITDNNLAVIQSALMHLSRSTLIAHNLKYDLHFLSIDPNRMHATLWDTLLMAHILDSRPPHIPGGQSKRLESLEQRWLGSKSKSVFSEPLEKSHLENYPPGMVAAYCVNDCRVTFDLAQRLAPELIQLGLWALFEKDIEFLKVLWAVERTGIQLDFNQCYQSIRTLQQDTQQLEQQLEQALGYPLHWRSNAKLSKALYQDYDNGNGWPKPVNPFIGADGIDHSRFAQKGKYNSFLTDAAILAKAHHPLAGLIADLRESEKILNYYTDFLEFNDGDRVHTNFHQTGTRTRRLSSSQPNFQNIASDVRVRSGQQTLIDYSEFIRTNAYNPRLALIARKDYRFVSIDYKQMEMRMFGLIANELEMIAALRTGEDIHAAVAKMVWGFSDKVRREWSKNIGFGLIYAMSVGALQFRLEMTRTEAQNIEREYKSRFTRIQPWLNEIIAECQSFGFVRYCSGAIWREQTPINFYKGANAVIQGACADLLSIAAIRCHAWLQQRGYGKIINLVHDEIDFELPIDTLPEAIPALSTIMQVSDLLTLPFFTDVKTGDSLGNWEEWTPPTSPV